MKTWLTRLFAERVSFVVLMLLPTVLLSQPSPWESLGPEGGSIVSLAQDPSNVNVLYAAPTGYPCRIFRSTDHGETWTYLSTIQNSVDGLLVDRPNGSILYANVGSGLYKSTNGGQTWSWYQYPRSTSPQLYFYVYEIILDPTQSNVLHASGYCWNGTTYLMAYMKSTDGGQQWTYKTLTSEYGFGYAVAVDAVNNQHIYVGGYAQVGAGYVGKLFKSTNGGMDFTDRSSSISGYIYEIATDPQGSGRVYAGAGGGIYRSTDGGNTWARHTGSWSTTYKFAFVPGVANTLFAGTSYGVYKSTDSGVTWSMTSIGIIGTGYGGFVLESSSPSSMFFANNAGVYRTSDGGLTWQACNCGLSCARITALCYAPSSPTTLYAAFEYNAVYKTTGATNSTVAWQRLPDFYACTNINAIVIPPTDPNRIYAMEGGG